MKGCGRQVGGCGELMPPVSVGPCLISVDARTHGAYGVWWRGQWVGHSPQGLRLQ